MSFRKFEKFFTFDPALQSFPEKKYKLGKDIFNSYHSRESILFWPYFKQTFRKCDGGIYSDSDMGSHDVGLDSR